MSGPTERPPFVPLPMAGGPAGPAPASAPPPPVTVVYLRYRDPQPLEFTGSQGVLPGPIFHAAGILLREDDEFIALGEVAHLEENPEYARRFGRDMFPAFRHVLTVPKAAIVERRDVRVGPSSPA